MAYEYQSFASLSVNLNRQKYGSLDISEVFKTQGDLNYYVSKGADTSAVSDYWRAVVPYPYAGQYIALVNEDRTVEAYILVEKEDGTFECKEVGKSPIGDEDTIVVAENGTISLAGVKGLDLIDDEGKSINYQPLLVNGKLTWVVPSATTVEGLASEIEGIKSSLETTNDNVDTNAQAIEALQGTVGDASSGLVKAVADNTEAIAKNAEDITDVSAVANAAKEAATANTAALEKVYTSEETDQKIAEEIAKQTHLQVKVVATETEVTTAGIIYLIKDTSAVGEDVYKEYMFLENAPVCIGSTSTNLSDYYNKTEVDGKVDAVSDEVDALNNTLSGEIDEVAQSVADLTTTVTNNKNAADSTYATKTELGDAVSGINSTLDNQGDSIEDHTTRIGNLETASGNHDQAISALQAVGAEKNKIDSVTAEFTVDANRQLSVNAIDQSKITGLTSKLDTIDEALSEKVDKVDGSRLITSDEATKLEKLVLNTDGTVEVSGEISASNVKELDTWVTNNRDAVAGLFSTSSATKLTGIEAGAQVNVIEAITVAGVNVNTTSLSGTTFNIPAAANGVFGVVAGVVADTETPINTQNTIGINASGQMEVNSLNVNKLIQADGDTLILDGGKA